MLQTEQNFQETKLWKLQFPQTFTQSIPLQEGDFGCLVTPLHIWAWIVNKFDLNHPTTAN